ncbi:PilZ domain-containing protein [Marinobacteraceae bacterium S3BR75-40.1]
MQASDSQPHNRPNLRHHHRVPADLVVEVTAESGASVECACANLSRAGLMLSCTPDQVSQILPNNMTIAPRQAVRLHARFKLPVLSIQSVQISVACDVIYVRRVSRDCFQVGMHFVDFEGSGRDYVDQYMDRRLQDTPV